MALAISGELATVDGDQRTLSSGGPVCLSASIASSASELGGRRNSTFGDESAVCSGPRIYSGPRIAEGYAFHPTAGRVSMFDQTTDIDRVSLNATVEHWWAPFFDRKRRRAAFPFTRLPMARLSLGYQCLETSMAGTFSIQTNMNETYTERCANCRREVAVHDIGPTVNLLD